MDWTNEANTLWMWVADSMCTVEQFAKPECPDENVACRAGSAIRSETAAPKPRVLSIPGGAGGDAALIVANLGPRRGDAQYGVMLTPSGIQTGETRQRESQQPVPSLAFQSGGRRQCIDRVVRRRTRSGAYWLTHEGTSYEEMPAIHRRIHARNRGLVCSRASR